MTHQYAENIGTFDFTYNYDARHNVCTGTDSYLCEIWYDELGRVTASKDPSGTQYVTYNDYNQITSRTDREGNTTEYAYDAAGNISEITYADGTTEDFTYDAMGNITSSTDKNGNVTKYVYDDSYNLIETIDAMGTSQRP